MTLMVAAVTLVVPDYDDAILFYRDCLGFDLLEDTDLGGGKRWVRVSPKGAQTAILLAKAVGDEQIAAIGNQCGGRVGFFLQTDDFIRDHEAFTQRGVQFLEVPRAEPYGNVAVFVDPFGNQWDLIEPKADDAATKLRQT